MPEHLLLEQLDSCLGAADPVRDVQLTGQWSSSTRRTYTSDVASRPASAPFTDVVDVRWRGTLASDAPTGALALLLHHGDLHWSRSPVISSSLGVEISLHSYADFQVDRATFASSVDGAWLPGVPISVDGAATDACAINDGVVTIGRVVCLARTTDATLFAILLPGELLKMGRKRIWRVRDAAPFDHVPAVRQLMIHGRTGTHPGKPRRGGARWRVSQPRSAVRLIAAILRGHPPVAVRCAIWCSERCRGRARMCEYLR